MDMKRKRDLRLLQEVIPVRHVIRSWYLHEGSRFMRLNKLSERDEDFLEKVTDFFLDNLEGAEQQIEEILSES